MDDNASSSASSSTSATTRMSSLHLLPLYRHTFVDSKLIDALFALLVPWPKAMMIIVIFSAIRSLQFNIQIVCILRDPSLNLN